MMKEKNFLRNCLIFSIPLLMGATCEQHQPPEVENCLLGDEGCICLDPRISEDPYVISFDECRNYHLTNPDDFATLKKWVNSKLRRLEQCENTN